MPLGWRGGAVWCLWWRGWVGVVPLWWAVGVGCGGLAAGGFRTASRWAWVASRVPSLDARRPPEHDGCGGRVGGAGGGGLGGVARAGSSLQSDPHPVGALAEGCATSCALRRGCLLSAPFSLPVEPRKHRCVSARVHRSLGFHVPIPSARASREAFSQLRLGSMRRDSRPAACCRDRLHQAPRLGAGS